MYLVPNPTKKYNDFSYKYLRGNRKAAENKNIFRKISDNEYIFLTQFNNKNNVGTNFTLENFSNEKAMEGILVLPHLKEMQCL